VIATATLIDSLKQLLAAANPGLATKDDIAELEQRVDELTELVAELEAKVASKGEKQG
jgi:hypothetical protein